jgi:hypothetical protein
LFESARKLLFITINTQINIINPHAQYTEAPTVFVVIIFGTISDPNKLNTICKVIFEKIDSVHVYTMAAVTPRRNAYIPCSKLRCATPKISACIIILKTIS